MQTVPNNFHDESSVMSCLKVQPGTINVNPKTHGVYKPSSLRHLHYMENNFNKTKLATIASLDSLHFSTV